MMRTKKQLDFVPCFSSFDDLGFVSFFFVCLELLEDTCLMIIKIFV